MSQPDLFEAISQAQHQQQEAEYHQRDGRAWLELPPAALADLKASDGDAILVSFEVGCDEGPPERRTQVGILGRARRIWLTDEVDMGHVDAVIVRRRRPA